MLKKGLCFLLMLPVSALAQSPNPDAGKDLFRTYCWQCHGENATGGGPMAEMIAVSTPDLTQLSARNEGVFPSFSVAEQIDGRAPLLAHGGVMPIFGPALESVQSVAIPTENGQPMIVSLPLADLLTYLEAIRVE